MRGSIKARGDAWRLVVDAGPDPVTGRRRQVVRNVKGTREEAERRLAQMLVDAGTGTPHDRDATVATLLDAWLTGHRGLSPSTRADYRSAIRRHLPAPFMSTKLWRVRTHDLDQLYTSLTAADVGDDRIRRVHTILRCAFAQAVRWQWIARNPAIDASPPSPGRRAITPPAPDELRRLLAAADAAGDFGVYLRLSAHLGARRGEVCALRWGDVDLDRGEVTIRRALVDGGRGVGVVVKGTKTDRERTLALDRRVVALLRAHQLVCAERALAVGVRLGPDSHLFSADAGGVVPRRPDAMTHEFATVRSAAGVEGVRLHDLRHFMITQLLAAGTDLRTVAGRAGHRRTSTTLDLYSAFLPASDRAAAERMGELLG